METTSILGLTGLALSIIGTALIWVDSQKAIGKIASLLKEVASTVGFWQDNGIEESKLSDFDDTINKTSKLDKRGFLLLIIGFIIQLLSYFDCFNLFSFN